MLTRILNFLREVKWLAVAAIVLAALAVVLAVLTPALSLLVGALLGAALIVAVLALKE